MVCAIWFIEWRDHNWDAELCVGLETLFMSADKVYPNSNYSISVHTKKKTESSVVCVCQKWNNIICDVRIHSYISVYHTDSIAEG